MHTRPIAATAERPLASRRLLRLLALPPLLLAVAWYLGGEWRGEPLDLELARAHALSACGALAAVALWRGAAIGGPLFTLWAALVFSRLVLPVPLDFQAVPDAIVLALAAAVLGGLDYAVRRALAGRPLTRWRHP